MQFVRSLRPRVLSSARQGTFFAKTTRYQRLLPLALQRRWNSDTDRSESVEDSGLFELDGDGQQIDDPEILKSPEFRAAGNFSDEEDTGFEHMFTQEQINDPNFGLGTPEFDAKVLPKLQKGPSKVLASKKGSVNLLADLKNAKKHKSWMRHGEIQNLAGAHEAAAPVRLIMEKTDPRMLRKNAGSRMDTIQQIILTQVLKYLRRSDQPFSFVDLNAGPALVQLEKHKKHIMPFELGLEEVWKFGLWSEDFGQSDFDRIIAPYLKCIKNLNPPNIKEGRYPSMTYPELVETPYMAPSAATLARTLMRKQDILVAAESDEVYQEDLAQILGGDRQVKIIPLNPRDAARISFPPRIRRGVSLLNIAHDHLGDNKLLQEFMPLYNKWPDGIHIITFPIANLDSRENEIGMMLRAVGFKKVAMFEMRGNVTHRNYRLLHYLMEAFASKAESMGGIEGLMNLVDEEDPISPLEPPRAFDNLHVDATEFEIMKRERHLHRYLEKSLSVGFKYDENGKVAAIGLDPNQKGNICGLSIEEFQTLSVDEQIKVMSAYAMQKEVSDHYGHELKAEYMLRKHGITDLDYIEYLFKKTGAIDTVGLEGQLGFGMAVVNCPDEIAADMMVVSAAMSRSLPTTSPEVIPEVFGTMPKLQQDVLASIGSEDVMMALQSATEAVPKPTEPEFLVKNPDIEEGAALPRVYWLHDHWMSERSDEHKVPLTYRPKHIPPFIRDVTEFKEEVYLRTLALTEKKQMEIDDLNTRKELSEDFDQEILDKYEGDQFFKPHNHVGEVGLVGGPMFEVQRKEFMRRQQEKEQKQQETESA